MQDSWLDLWLKENFYNFQFGDHSKTLKLINIISLLLIIFILIDFKEDTIMLLNYWISWEMCADLWDKIRYCELQIVKTIQVWVYMYVSMYV